ncbi:hypothetical protein BDZ91DRAFT_777688 [Kalaharituber pfeilii]|nr:hypothetical protein BDZ91DRAFT_777688 [Kalaharituber pfeilii]
MPRSKSILPREGLHLDPILLLLRRFVINPTVLLPLVIALERIPAIKPFLLGNEKWVRRLRLLLYLGLFERVNAFLSDKALNNWTEDQWNWDEEIIVVTGGSAGIGEKIVMDLSERLKEKGKKGKIAVIDIMPLGYEAPDNVVFFKADLSIPTEIAAAAEQIRQNVGHPTVLINNAGVCRGKSILDATEKDLRLVFDVNVLSHWLMAKEFLPEMIKKGHGHIVTVASIGAYVQAPRMVDYNASKAASLSFYEGLKQELKFTYKAPKIRTTIVTQGYVKTPLFEGYNHHSTFLYPPLQPETVAEAIVDQVLSGKGGHITLPRTFNAFTGIRGWFSWCHLRALSRVGDVMDTWQGRQVKDPDATS